MEKMAKKNYGFRIDQDLLSKIEAKAIQREETTTNCIIEAIKLFLDEDRVSYPVEKLKSLKSANKSLTIENNELKQLLSLANENSIKQSVLNQKLQEKNEAMVSEVANLTYQIGFYESRGT